MKTKLILAAILGLNAFSAVAQDALDLAVSGWAGWMRGSVVVDGQEAKIHRDSMNYYEDLGFGGSLELVLRNSSMVVLGSVDYIDGITSDVTVGNQGGTLESSEIIGVLAVGYPMSQGSSTLEVYFGLQMLQMENDLKLDGADAGSDSADLYDAVMLVRYKQELFSNFYLNVPLTIGGTYLSDSQFVYDAGVQLLYQFGDSFDVRVGYRITGYDFSDDTPATDFYQQGYTVGLGMTF